MKRISLFALAIFSVTFLSAQPPDRFIKYYYPEPNIGAFSDDIIATDYGYILTGIAIDTIGIETGYYKRIFKGIDFNGELLWEKHYGNKDSWYSSYINQKTCFAKDGTDYYYLSPILEVDYENDKYTTCSQLMKLTNTGDTLWTKNYYGNPEWPYLALIDMNILPDGGFALVGIMGLEMEEGGGIPARKWVLFVSFG